MVKVNRRVHVLFSKFCIGYCVHHRDGICTETLGKATLEHCPIAEWWELNDWVTSIEGKLKAIVKRTQKIKNHGVDDVSD